MVLVFRFMVALLPALSGLRGGREQPGGFGLLVLRERAVCHTAGPLGLVLSLHLWALKVRRGFQPLDWRDFGHRRRSITISGQALPRYLLLGGTGSVRLAAWSAW